MMENYKSVACGKEAKPTNNSTESWVALYSDEEYNATQYPGWWTRMNKFYF
jgi:hypothetical protein